MPLDLTKERILVTGGNGFLGRHVVRRLRAMGCEVFAPMRNPVESVVCTDSWDLTDWEPTFGMFRRERPSVVVHLAAYCGGIGKNQSTPAAMARENLDMGSHVVSACHLLDVKKLVTVGSVCSYPENCPVPFKESDLHNGYPESTNAPYGIAKRAMWTLLDAYHRQYGLKCAYLIPANLYGPGDHFEGEGGHVIPMMIRKILDARPFEDVIFWGSGRATRDFLYVEDCAEAIIRAAERIDSPEPINIGTGVETSIDDLGSLIAGWNPVTPTWDHSKPDGQRRRVLDTSRAKELLGWEAKTPLYEGLQKTVAWYREHRQVTV